MKKILAKIYTVLFTVSVFLIFGFVAIMIPASSQAFYRSQFEKYDVLKSVQFQHRYLEDENAREYIQTLTDEELDDLMMHVVRYCLFLEDDLNITVDGVHLEIFRDDEYSHMQDVKNVFGGGLIIVLVSVIIILVGVVLFLIYRKGYYENCRKIPFITLAVIGGLLVLVALYALIDFESAFTLFHVILFDGNWMFSHGVMITMIGQIFFDIVPIIAVIWIGLILSYVLALYLYNKILAKKSRNLSK